MSFCSLKSDAGPAVTHAHLAVEVAAHSMSGRVDRGDGVLSAVGVFFLVAALRDAIAVAPLELLRHEVEHGRLGLRERAGVNPMNHGPLSKRRELRRRLLPPRRLRDHRLYPRRLPLHNLLLLLRLLAVLLRSLRRRPVPRRRCRSRCAALSGVVRGLGGRGPADGPAL